MRLNPIGSLLVLITLISCGGEVGPEVGPYTDHDESSDFDEVTFDGKADGILNSFNRENIMADHIFVNDTMINADQLQQFFERSPYNNRSWLADHRVGGLRAADLIIAGSREKGINPIVMVARMQVEKSLVSKTSRPSDRSVNYAFGCGCPDNQACNPQYRGLDKQVACAANTLRKHYDGSVAGTGAWRKGRARRTLDPISVTPRNHATASLYAYTPWVLEGRGGNWLVWNITRRYLKHFITLGILDQSDLEPGGGNGGGGGGGGGLACFHGNKQGVCQNTSKACDGEYQSNLCVGPANIKCCVPLDEPNDWGTCSQSGKEGVCQDSGGSCDGSYASGLCPGPAKHQVLSTQRDCVAKVRIWRPDRRLPKHQSDLQRELPKRPLLGPQQHQMLSTQRDCVAKVRIWRPDRRLPKHQSDLQRELPKRPLLGPQQHQMLSTQRDCVAKVRIWRPDRRLPKHQSDLQRELPKRPLSGPQQH
jgi:hypothetical protein